MAAHQKHNSNQAQETALKRRTTGPADRKPVTVALEPDPLILQRAVANPGLASPGDILSLQHTYGNRAVTRLVQAKLRVGPVGDHYEQEADRVADQVMSMPAPTSDARSAEGGGRSTVQRQEMPEEEELLQGKPLVQRQEMPEEEELLQAKPLVQRQEMLEEEELLQGKPLVQRQEMLEEEELLQGKSLIQRQADGGFEASDDIARRIAGRKGSGSSLPDNLQAEMESRFGADFSAVRVHTDSEADKLNKNLRARAFTHGTDIYLGAGQYDPGSSDGQRLLAHELTHVVQQTGRQPVDQNDRAANRDGLSVTHTHSQASQGTGVIQATNGNKSMMELLREEMRKRRRAMVGDDEYEEEREEETDPYHDPLHPTMSPLVNKRPPDRSTEETETDPYHDPLHPTMSPLVNKRPPDRSIKETETDPYHDPLHPTMSPLVNKRPPDRSTVETDPYHDPMHPTMSPLVNKRPPDRSTVETDPYHDPMHPTMSPLVNKRPPERTEKKPGFFSRLKSGFAKFTQGRREERARKKWGIGKEEWNEMPDVVKKSHMASSRPKEAPKPKPEAKKGPLGAWETLKSGWGMAKESLKWGLTSKLLPPGVRLAMAKRRALAKRGGETGQPQQLRQGIIREKVGKAPPSPKKPSPEEKTETSGGGGILTLAKDIGGLQSRIVTLEKELASLKSTK